MMDAKDAGEFARLNAELSRARGEKDEAEVLLRIAKERVAELEGEATEHWDKMKKQARRIAELEAEVDAIWDKVIAEIERMRSTKRAAITSAYVRGKEDGFCPKCTKIG
jgi:predicted  nucleic acid-binding Zn-ribbon protein